MISLREVSKNIKGKQVLDNISVEFEDGKMYLLKGHNGCGKTMLLRMLCGLIKPTSGCIEKEEDYTYGVMIENPQFMENETGYYNLKYLASIQKKIGKQEIEEIMKTLNLYDVRNKKVKSYSLGMKQRLGIVQALMEDPKIILLDEPFNALDEQNYNAVFQRLKVERNRGKMIVIAAHSLDSKRINEFDSIIQMDNGKIPSL